MRYRSRVFFFFFALSNWFNFIWWFAILSALNCLCTSAKNQLTKYVDFWLTNLPLVFIFLLGSEVKASACNVGDLGSIPGLGRSPGEGNGNQLQYSCLENPMDRGAWWAILHGVAKSRTRLRDFTMSHCLDSVSSVQLLSRVWLFATPWTTARQASLSITNSWSTPMSVMPSNHLILCRPLLPLPPIFPGIRVFSNESALCIRWPKYWSFSFNISPSNEHPGLISFRMDWLDLLVVQGTLKSLLQHHSSKASILWCSAFFIVQLSHRYMTTGKTIALTRQTFVGKVMSLLLNMLSRLVITFLPRSKHFLISWLIL